jgi:hypothetical protein
MAGKARANPALILFPRRADCDDRYIGVDRVERRLLPRRRYPQRRVILRFFRELAGSRAMPCTAPEAPIYMGFL